MEKFVEYIEEEVKRLYETLPRQLMTKLIDVLQREHEAAESVTFTLKSLMIQGIERLRINATTLVYIEEQPTIIAT